MNKAIFLFITVTLFLCSSSFTWSQPTRLSQPEKDFEIFWTTFKDHYAFFSLKQVDWDQQYKLFRPRVTAKTKSNELIKLLIEMVEPLQDGHITITKKDEVLFTGKGHRNHFRSEFAGIEKEFWQNTDQMLQHSGFEKVAPYGPIGKTYHPYYFAKSGDIAYLRITRMFAELSGIMGDEKAEQSDQKLMLKLLDDLLVKFQDCRGLIIDLRGNGGGHSGYEMASRFAAEQKITHYKALRTAGNYESFTELQPFSVIPHNSVRFVRPIVILTSDRTASAAEDFVLSLYEQSHVTLVGDTTRGMFSDTFNGRLSDGIEFSLSHQRYYNNSKQLLEDKGISPKYLLKNTRQELERKEDGAIQQAIKLLRK